MTDRPCKVCGRKLPPKFFIQGTCSQCNYVIAYIMSEGMERNRAEKLAYAKAVHEEALRRLSE